jgi:hypothetical protein
LGEDATVKRDRNGLWILDEASCRYLLSTVPVARIGLVLFGAPVVLPVNIVVVDDDVVFRSARGSKLDAAIIQDLVVVQADRYDEHERTGWSVVAKGPAAELTEPDLLARVDALNLAPWGIPTADHVIAVRMHVLSGRSIGTPPELEGRDPAP